MRRKAIRQRSFPPPIHCDFEIAPRLMDIQQSFALNFPRVDVAQKKENAINVIFLTMLRR